MGTGDVIADAGRALVAVLACVAAAAAAGCGEERLDTPKIERGIKRRVELNNPGTEVTVSCPDHVTQKKGGRFTCKVVTQDGREWEALVTQVDDRGRVRYLVQRGRLPLLPAGE